MLRHRFFTWLQIDLFVVYNLTKQKSIPCYLQSASSRTVDVLNNYLETLQNLEVLSESQKRKDFKKYII